MERGGETIESRIGYSGEEEEEENPIFETAQWEEEKLAFFEGGRRERDSFYF